MPRRIGFIHPDPTAAIIFPINGFYHFFGRRCLDLYPAVHFFHINPTEHALTQITHIKNKLKEAGFIETILCTKIYKEFFIIAVAKGSSSCITMNCLLTFFLSLLTEVKIGSIFIILQKPVEFQRSNPLQNLFFFYRCKTFL